MRAILFDFGGTLDHPRHWLDRFLQHYRANGIDVSRVELDAAYAHATRTAYGSDAAIHHHNLGELITFLVHHQLDHLHREGPERLRGHLGGQGDARHELADRISTAFANESRMGLNFSRDILRHLSRDFKLGVVSNFYGNLDVILAEAGIRELIQVAIDSKHAGIFKPDERIFAAALHALDVPHNQVAMVGDSLSKDIAPASRLGMRTVWLRHAPAADSGADSSSKPPSETAPPPEVEASADYRIRSLEELKEIVW